MTQDWRGDGTGNCQFCGAHVVCEGTQFDHSFDKEHECHEYQLRDCSNCGRFRITGTAQWYSDIPSAIGRRVSSWIIKKQTEVPLGGSEYTDLPLVTSDLIDCFRSELDARQ